MRIGLALPHYEYSFPDPAPLTWEAVADAAARAERLGFDSLWISDHFFANLSRYGGPDEPNGTVEPFSALAALAATTERVRLGTLVACAPFRHPAHVAKMATTIDLASGGRFDLGIGAGWYEREFDAFGYGFGTTGERFRLLEEYTEVLARLLREPGPVQHEGPAFRLRDAYNHPAPAREGGVPVWVGGKGGDRLLRLVARHGDGWNTVWRWTAEALGERADALRRICEDGGRDPSTVRVSVGLLTLVAEDERDLERRYRALQAWSPGGALEGMPLDAYAKDTLTGTVEECLERIAAFAKHGVEETIVSPASLPFGVADWELVDLIGERLIPQAHRL